MDCCRNARSGRQNFPIRVAAYSAALKDMPETCTDAVAGSWGLNAARHEDVGVGLLEFWASARMP